MILLMGPWLQRICRASAWLLALAIVVLSLVPPSYRPITEVSHNIKHFAIFLTTGFAFCVAYPDRPFALATGLVIFCGAIELAQVPGRHARLSDFIVDAVSDPDKMEAALRRQTYHIIILDYVIPGLQSEQVLEWVRETQPDASIIVVTAYPSIDSALNCLRARTHDYLTKPFQIAHLQRIVTRCLESKGLLRMSEEALRESLGSVIRERRKSGGEALEPVLVGRRQGQCQGRPGRRCTHCGEIGEVDGERAPADVVGAGAAREMPAVDQRVGAGDEFVSRGNRQHGRIVADTEGDVGAALADRREVPLDQLELVHRDPP